LAEGRP